MAVLTRDKNNMADDRHIGKWWQRTSTLLRTCNRPTRQPQTFHLTVAKTSAWSKFKMDFVFWTNLGWRTQDFRIKFCLPMENGISNEHKSCSTLYLNMYCIWRINCLLASGGNSIVRELLGSVTAYLLIVGFNVPLDTLYTVAKCKPFHVW